MSNGFSAADMSTAAANGHAEGYQAGYADAVKAVEAGGSPDADARSQIRNAFFKGVARTCDEVAPGISLSVAAQEAVAYLNSDSSAKRATKQAAPKELWGRKLTRSERQCWAQGFNAAPVSAAPVDLPTPRSREKFIKAIEGMSVSVDVDRLFDTDGRRLFGTVTTVQHDDGDKHGLTLLVQDAQPNWEESTPAAPVDAIKRLQEAIEGELDGLSVDYKTAESILAHTFHVPPLNIKGAAEVARVIGYEFDNDGTGEGLKDLEVIVKAASTPAAPGIDLEQFWPAVCAMGLFAETPTDVEEAKRLLALIDASPKGVNTAAPRIDLATAWAEGYRSGVTDERISESNIGIAGFGAKIEPARANPYLLAAPVAAAPVVDSRLANWIIAAVGDIPYSTMTSEQVIAALEANRRVYEGNDGCGTNYKGDSTPAAPGIDLRSAILQLRDEALHMKDPGDTVNAYDRVLRLIDASPKGDVRTPKAGEQIADILIEWRRNKIDAGSALAAIEAHLDACTFQPANDLNIGYEAGMRLAREVQGANPKGGSCDTCGPDGIRATDGSGPYDCYACGKKATSAEVGS